MLLILRTLKQIGLILGVILLSDCTNVTDLNVEPPVHHKLVSPFTLPAAGYLALAKNNAGSEKQALMMMAAGRLIDEGQWQEGFAILSRISNPSPAWASERQLLLAKIDILREQPHAAITKLASVRDINNMPIYYQVQFHEMLAEAYVSVANITASVNERVKLEHLIPDETSKMNNRRALWLTLTTLPEPELDTLRAEAREGSALEGWLQLAHVAKASHDTPQMIIAELLQWQIVHATHPGNTIFSSPIQNMTQSLFSTPKHMALMLPLTGPFEGPGSAIKAGFMAAYEASHTPHDVKISYYNTDEADVGVLYQQAIAEGADFIVGPLVKANVASVAAMDHPVPTLLLNEVPSLPNPGAYQLSLSQRFEAQQVALKARQKGHGRALVIAPSGEWGDEVITAFEKLWKTRGGLVVDTLHYRPNDNTDAMVRNFLKISDSETRQQALKTLLGPHLEVTPSRRQDFDVIFLVAYPSKARQIMPLLKYYYAGDVPVYATSMVYAGNPNAMKDKDLDGIIFSDMPWVFTHNISNKNWPEQFNSYNRLYALGMDSYELSRSLNPLLLFPSIGVSDNSGIFYLNSSQQIVRTLAFGEFKKGLISRLNP